MTDIYLSIFYTDGVEMDFQVEDGWKLDAGRRAIVLNRGVPRMHIPLDNVRFFTVNDGIGPSYRA